MVLRIDQVDLTCLRFLLGSLEKIGWFTNQYATSKRGYQADLSTSLSLTFTTNKKSLKINKTGETNSEPTLDFLTFSSYLSPPIMPLLWFFFFNILKVIQLIPQLFHSFPIVCPTLFLSFNLTPKLTVVFFFFLTKLTVVFREDF